MALTFTPIEPGLKLPAFALPDLVSGQIYDQNYLLKAKASLVMFICSHCPYVQAIEERLIVLGHDLAQIDVKIIAICANDATDHPEDLPKNLRKRAIEKNYSFPYLHDSTQKVALSFGAACTPDFFLFGHDGVLAYRGRLDDNWKDPAKVTRRELYQAALALSTRQAVDLNPFPSMGCSIKWLATANLKHADEN